MDATAPVASVTRETIEFTPTINASMVRRQTASAFHQLAANTEEDATISC